MLDEVANIFDGRYLYGEHGRICGGHKRESRNVLPEEVCRFAVCYRQRKMSGWIGAEVFRGDSRLS